MVPVVIRPSNVMLLSLVTDSSHGMYPVASPMETSCTCRVDSFVLLRRLTFRCTSVGIRCWHTLFPV